MIATSQRFSEETILTEVPQPEPVCALVRFWQAAYQRYEIPLAEGSGFHVPQFPFPLLSPMFVTGDRDLFLRRNGELLGYFNEIVPLGHDQRGPAPKGFRLDKQFYLGERRISRRAIPAGLRVRVMPLAEAAEGNELWNLLGDGFGRDVDFLRMLLPFLSTLDADFRTIFLEEQGRTVGAVSVGVAGGAAIVLNAVMLSSDRGKGLSQALTDAAQSLAVELGATDAFFWTEHAFLGRHADLIRHYRIFVKAVH